MQPVTIEIKGDAGSLTVDPSKLPDEIYAAVFAAGLKAFLEKNMTTYTKAKHPDPKARSAAIFAQAQQNLEAMYQGKTKLPKGKEAAGVAREVMTEALRLAEKLVKDWMKANKIKIADVPKAELKAKAKELVAADASLIETAKANIESRKTITLSPTLFEGIKVDPVLSAANADKAAKRKAAIPTVAAPKPAKGKVPPRIKATKPAPQVTVQ